MPVAIFQLNVNPKHMVINLIIPHVAIQLNPKQTITMKINATKLMPLPLIFN